MEYTFIKMLLARLKSKSPKFYIDLRYMSGAIVFLSGFAVVVVKAHFFPIPVATATQVLTISTEIATFMGGIFGASFTGTTDQTLIQPPKESETIKYNH